MPIMKSIGYSYQKKHYNEVTLERREGQGINLNRLTSAKLAR